MKHNYKNLNICIIDSYKSYLNLHRKRMKILQKNYNKLSDKEKEYCDYLIDWFGGGFCDGINTYEERIRGYYCPYWLKVEFFETN